MNKSTDLSELWQIFNVELDVCTLKLSVCIYIELSFNAFAHICRRFWHIKPLLQCLISYTPNNICETNFIVYVTLLARVLLLFQLINIFLMIHSEFSLSTSDSKLFIWCKQLINLSFLVLVYMINLVI